MSYDFNTVIRAAQQGKTPEQVAQEDAQEEGEVPAQFLGKGPGGNWDFASQGAFTGDWTGKAGGRVSPLLTGPLGDEYQPLFQQNLLVQQMLARIGSPNAAGMPSTWEAWRNFVPEQSRGYNSAAMWERNQSGMPGWIQDVINRAGSMSPGDKALAYDHYVNGVGVAPQYQGGPPMPDDVRAALIAAFGSH